MIDWREECGGCERWLNQDSPSAAPLAAGARPRERSHGCFLCCACYGYYQLSLRFDFHLRPVSYHLSRIKAVLTIHNSWRAIACHRPRLIQGHGLQTCHSDPRCARMPSYTPAAPCLPVPMPAGV